MAGALVVALQEDGRFRVLTTDGGGPASQPVDPPWPGGVAAGVLASGRWSFVGWRSAREGEVLEVTVSDAVGDAVVHLGEAFEDQEAAAALRLVSAEAGEVSPYLLRVGLPLHLRAGLPLRIEGLPVGAYTASAGAASRTFRIEAGREVEVELP